MATQQYHSSQFQNAAYLSDIALQHMLLATQPDTKHPELIYYYFKQFEYHLASENIKQELHASKKEGQKSPELKALIIPYECPQERG